MQADTLIDTYDPHLLRALGLLTLEFSGMEAAALDLLARLTSPDQFTGEISVAGSPLSSALDRVQAMTSPRTKRRPTQEAEHRYQDRDGQAVARRSEQLDGRDLQDARGLSCHLIQIPCSRRAWIIWRGLKST